MDILTKLEKNKNKVEIGLYLLGVIWVFLFPLVCISTLELKPRGTYNDENALSVPYITPSFTRSDLEACKMLNKTNLVEIYKELNLFRVNNKFGSQFEENLLIIVLSEEDIFPSVECFAASLQKSAWLSKNILFQFIDTNSVGLAVKLANDYYSGTLNLGLLYSVFIFEVDIKQLATTSVSLFYQGFNGQLPNQDYVNLVYSVLKYKCRSCEIDRQASTKSDLYKNLFKEIRVQGYERSEKLHGNFLRLNVDALTVNFKIINGQKEISQMLRVMESCIRGMSNTVEKLHHSFFFYYLLSTEVFVSIDEYAWSLALLMGPVLVEILVGLGSFNPYKEASGGNLLILMFFFAFVSNLGVINYGLALPLAAFNSWFYAKAFSDDNWPKYIPFTIAFILTSPVYHLVMVEDTNYISGRMEIISFFSVNNILFSMTLMVHSFLHLLVAVKRFS
eukprot:snap_masked-scaffold_29-processed-gene-1.24-mRNA-1 protein AED:1.00 eAED:1.00 QI:0/-1/0/0/-1/1/1/0/447